MEGDKEVQINVYSIEAGDPYKLGEYRHTGLVTTEGTNYIDIITEDGQLAITLQRNRETKKFEFGLLISKVDPESGGVQERRVYRGNLFDEPFERPPLTDAQRQAQEEEMLAIEAPRLRSSPRLHRVTPPVDEDLDFTTGEDEPEDEEEEPVL